MSSDEHQRRSPDCMFFSLTASTQSKRARTKNDRTSKAGRTSTQSNFTSDLEAPSFAETEVEEGDSALTTATDATTTSTMPKTSKKGGRTKKPVTKGTKSAMTQVLDVEHTSSFIEPEDDDFEVKVAPLPSKSTRGKKRTSAEMDVQTATQNQVLVSDTALTQAPPAKRRATRSRSTFSQAYVMPVEQRHATQDVDLNMTDVETMPPPQVIASKKGGKGGKKRASSSARVVSTASTASMASLRAPAPADDEIDAVLEAELDRPLTDDEQPDIAETQEEKRPKTRRLTRTRPGSRKVTASIAPVRQTRASTFTIDPVGVSEEQRTETLTLDDPIGLVSDKEMHSASGARPIEEDLVVSKKKTAKGKTLRKASASQRNPAMKTRVEEPRGVHQSHDINMVEEAVQDVEVSVAPDVAKPQSPPRSSRSRQISRSSPAQRSRVSEASTSDHVADVVMDVDSSTVTARTLEDESGHETDTSATSRAPPKKAAGRVAGSVKKGKGGKKSATLNHNIEDVGQQPKLTSGTQKRKDKETSKEHEDVEVQPEDPLKGAAQLPSTESFEPVVDAPAKELKPNKRAAKSTKKKAGKPKTKAIAVDAPNHAREENNGIIPQDTQPAKHSSPPPSETSDPTLLCTHKPTATIANPATQPASPPPPFPHHTTPSPSPQSSDAENHPPTAPHSLNRTPLSTLSPSKRQEPRIHIAASTPTSNRTAPSSRLQSAFPWTAIDLESVFVADESPGKENRGLQEAGKHGLTSPEKKMSVEEWILWNAGRGEERLRAECERLVGRFEGEGVRALRALEGIVVLEG